MLWCTRNYPKFFGWKTWQYLKTCSFSILLQFLWVRWLSIQEWLMQRYSLRIPIRIFWKLVLKSIFLNIIPYENSKIVIHSTMLFTMNETLLSLSIANMLILMQKISYIYEALRNVLYFAATLYVELKNYYFWFTKKSWKDFKKHEK